METSAEGTPDWRKRIVGVLVAAIVITAFTLLLTTHTGYRIRHHPHSLYADVRPFLDRHLLLAPLVYMTLYIVLAVLALPIWWLQVLAGLAFGLYEGVFLSLIASTNGALLSVALSRWIGSDWFHNRIESRIERLKKIEEILGHNGFLVVLTIRLVHILPFGLCNYALGLIRVSYMDVLFGTLLGGIPAIALYVGGGAGYRVWHDLKFDAVIGVINILLLLPLALRYLRPQWFRKIGVE